MMQNALLKKTTIFAFLQQIDIILFLDFIIIIIISVHAYVYVCMCMCVIHLWMLMYTHHTAGVEVRGQFLVANSLLYFLSQVLSCSCYTSFSKIIDPQVSSRCFSLLIISLLECWEYRWMPFHLTVLCGV